MIDELEKAALAISELPLDRWAGALLFIIAELRAIAIARNGDFGYVLKQLADVLNEYAAVEI